MQSVVMYPVHYVLLNFVVRLYQSFVYNGHRLVKFLFIVHDEGGGKVKEYE